jgi:arsenate reductase
VADIPADEVDLVVTLCAEEECPVFLGTAGRLHWGLPDPAVVQDSEEASLTAFRRTRDELRRRIAALLSSEDQKGQRK